LEKIDANKSGVILATDSDGAVIGIATDGDIRRALLKDAALDDALSTCLNRQFFWADKATPREMLLKRLDRIIRMIPVLDENRRLVGVVCRDNLPVQTEEAVYARARSPVRVSFGGGGSDLTHFFCNHGGAVINTTISLYSHATLRLRDDKEIRIHSRDLGETLVAENLHQALEPKGRFGLIQALLKTIQPEFGFELYLHSDFPMNSGLGGSAVVSAAVLGCFNQFRRDRWDLHEISELAFQAERLMLNVAGGWQDQYASVFGGFNFMEFRMAQNLVHPLRVHADTLLELEESLVLCDTGTSHDSGAIHDDQRGHMSCDAVQNLVKGNVELTYQLRDHLLRGRLLEFGRLLDTAWQYKRQFSEKISNPQLDAIYTHAMNHGAVGGKLMGAGGGGFFIFYVTPFRRHELMEALEVRGLSLRRFRFDQEGLRAWTVRECKNNTENNSLCM
jgi:D-glycero-alpha-D-manno-heptose-7-phosphate kinase